MENFVDSIEVPSRKLLFVFVFETDDKENIDAPRYEIQCVPVQRQFLKTTSIPLVDSTLLNRRETRILPPTGIVLRRARLRPAHPLDRLLLEDQ